MNTIKSRWKWIRREAYVVLFLTILFVFPDLPGQAFSLIKYSGLTEAAARFIAEQDRLAGDEPGSVYIAESGTLFRPATFRPADTQTGHSDPIPTRPAAYPVIDPGSKLTNRLSPGSPDSTAVTYFTVEDAMLLESEDAETAREVYKAAAEEGNRLAQYKLLEMEGVSPTDFDVYLARLFELQQQSVAWQTHFEAALRALYNQADRGNPNAVRALSRLSVEVP